VTDLEEHGVETITKQAVENPAVSGRSPATGFRFMTHSNNGQHEPSRRVDKGAYSASFSLTCMLQEEANNQPVSTASHS
jgi:hypothetical protein